MTNFLVASKSPIITSTKAESGAARSLSQQTQSIALLTVLASPLGVKWRSKLQMLKRATGQATAMNNRADVASASHNPECVDVLWTRR